MNGSLEWTAVPGASGYLLQESTDGMTTSRNYALKSTVTSYPIRHRASDPAKLHYVLTATYETGVSTPGASADACTGEVQIEIPSDPEFRALTRRMILPVVGSTPGAQGGRFKTSLKLIGTASDQRGRIVFHPAGRPASASDPSIAYKLVSPGETLAFDDIVAELGQNGLGSIDIVPDETAQSNVPRVEARLFNDTEQGTFGTFAQAIRPYDYLHPQQVIIDVPDARFRLNIGVRTLTATAMQVLVYGTNGRLRALKDLSFPAEYMTMVGAAQFLGVEVTPGESVSLLVSGSAIPFYTLTENRTNDPTLIVPPARATSTTVGSYID